jgi:hypothetical protein
MWYRNVFYTVLFFSCASRQSVPIVICDEARFSSTDPQFTRGYSIVFDTIAGGANAVVYDTETKMSLPAIQMQMIRGGDTIVTESDSAGMTSVLRNDIGGIWKFRFSSRDYQCLLIADVKLKNGHMQYMKVGLRRK